MYADMVARKSVKVKESIMTTITMSAAEIMEREQQLRRLEMECQEERRRLRELQKACRAEAKEIVRQRYERYDEIWYGRIRLTEEVYAHFGKEGVADLQAKMPNLLTKNGNCSTIDLVAEEYGFEDVSELVEYLQAYEPRKPLENSIFEKLLEEKYAAMQQTSSLSMEPPYDYDEVPF